MIQDELELQCSYETLAKLYRLRERCAAEPLWDPEMREDTVEGIESQIQKIEREVAAYLLDRRAMKQETDETAKQVA